MMTKESIFMVFDVESIGLHGEGFAVGCVVINGSGEELFNSLLACPPFSAEGSAESRDWVRLNIPEFGCRYESPKDVRDAFWSIWEKWNEKGALLFADCLWPVEARFLAQCVDDLPKDREWMGPYPLHDIASVILASGGDPLAKNQRMENELPEHNPLADARQSARLLIEALSRGGHLT